MNTETGEIRHFTKESFKDLVKGDKWEEVFDEQMTEKQKEELQVSKFDNRSELGKIFTGNRAERRRQEREHCRMLKRKNKLASSQ